MLEEQAHKVISSCLDAGQMQWSRPVLVLGRGICTMLKEEACEILSSHLNRQLQ
jgi:hypothetical protein